MISSTELYFYRAPPQLYSFCITCLVATIRTVPKLFKKTYIIQKRVSQYSWCSSTHRKIFFLFRVISISFFDDYTLMFNNYVIFKTVAMRFDWPKVDNTYCRTYMYEFRFLSMWRKNKYICHIFKLFNFT